MFQTKDSGKRMEFETGALRDTQDGKPRYDLVGHHGLKRLAELMARGAEKYGERNWEKGQSVSRSYASAFRHLLQYFFGERDEDHLAAVAFNVFSIIHVEEEVKNGSMPVSLLDFDFYKNCDEFRIHGDDADISWDTKDEVDAVYDIIANYQAYSDVPATTLGLIRGEIKRAFTRLHYPIDIDTLDSILKQLAFSRRISVTTDLARGQTFYKPIDK